MRRILQNDWLLDLLFFAVLIIAFYTAWLGSYPVFTPDEGRYTEVAREMIASGDYITPRVNGVVFLDKPILYYWLQAAAIKVFGLKEWAFRFFPALFGVFGCLITYVCGRMLFDRRTAFMASSILATSTLYFACAHYANLDLEVAVLISAALLCFITGIQNPTPALRLKFMCAAYFFSATAMLTKGMIGIIFPVMIIGLWMLLLNQWRVLTKMYLHYGLLIYAVVLTPWYYFIQKNNPEFMHYFFVTQHVKRFLSTETFNNQSPVWFYLPVIFLGLFPWSLFVLQAIVKNMQLVLQRNKQYLTEFFLLIWSISVFTFFTIPHSKIISYILPIFPALALLLANYFIHASKAMAQQQKKIVSLFMIGGLIFALTLLIMPYVTVTLIPKDFFWHLKAIAIVFICFSFIAVICAHENVIFHIYMWATGIAFYLLIVISGAVHLNTNTAKPLAVYLASKLKPQDEVVNYFKYYYDVPLYLQKKVTLVSHWDPVLIRERDNWARELIDGRNKQHAYWLIDEKSFWVKWQMPKRLYVFLNANYFEQFKSHTDHYYVLAVYNNIVLLSNIADEDYLNTQNLLETKVSTGNMVNVMNKAI